MLLNALSRKELQALAKDHGIKANSKTSELIELLAQSLASEPTASEEPAGAAAAQVELVVEPSAQEEENSAPETVGSPPTPAVREHQADATWSTLAKRLPTGPAVMPSEPPQPAAKQQPKSTEPGEANAASVAAEPTEPVPATESMSVDKSVPKPRPGTAGNKRPWAQTPFVPLKSARPTTAHESVPACAGIFASRSFEVKSLDAAKKAREAHRAIDERSAALREAAKKRRDVAMAKLHAQPLNGAAPSRPLAPKAASQAQVPAKGQFSRSRAFVAAAKSSRASAVAAARVENA